MAIIYESQSKGINYCIKDQTTKRQTKRVHLYVHKIPHDNSNTTIKLHQTDRLMINFVDSFSI